MKTAIAAIAGAALFAVGAVTGTQLDVQYGVTQAMAHAAARDNQLGRNYDDALWNELYPMMLQAAEQGQGACDQPPLP